MARSSKLADAHIQFSTKGLSDLVRDVNKAGAAAEKLEKSTRRAAGGKSSIGGSLFGDVNQLAKFQRELQKVISLGQRSTEELKKLRKVQRQLASDKFAAAGGNVGGSKQMAAELAAFKAQAQQFGLGARRNNPITSAIVNRRAAIETGQVKPTSAFANRMGAQNIAAGLSADRSESVRKARETADRAIARREAEALMNSPAFARASASADRLQGNKPIPPNVLSALDKSRGRGSLADASADAAASRRKSLLDRQSERDFRNVNPVEIARRRIREVESTGKGDSDVQLTVRDMDAELAMEARSLAESLREAAADIRNAPIDRSLAELNRKLSKGQLSSGDFRADVTRENAKGRGVDEAGKISDDVTFRARGGGKSEGTISDEESLETLEKRKKELEAVASGSKKLTAAEKEQNKTEQELLETEIKLKKSQLDISKEMDKLEAAAKPLITQRAALNAKQAHGVKLTKDEKRELRDLNKQLGALSVKAKSFEAAQGGVNGSMHSGARASRNFNFRLQQGSYAVQDFVQVIGQTGLSGALRASANNIAQVFAVMGTAGGAIAGGIATVVMIGLADAITAMGGEAETATEKLERLIRKTGEFRKLRSRNEKLAAESAGLRPGVAPFGMGQLDALAGEAREAASKRSNLKEDQKTASEVIVEDERTVSGEPKGLFGAYFDLLKQNTRHFFATEISNFRGNFERQAVAEAALAGGEDNAKEELRRQFEKVVRINVGVSGEGSDEDIKGRIAGQRDKMIRLGASPESAGNISEKAMQKLLDVITEREEIQRRIVTASESDVEFAKAFDVNNDELKKLAVSIEESENDLKNLSKNLNEKLAKFNESVLKYTEDTIETANLRDFGFINKEIGSLTDQIEDVRSKIRESESYLESVKDDDIKRPQAEQILSVQKDAARSLEAAAGKLGKAAEGIPISLSGISGSLTHSVDELLTRKRERDEAGTGSGRLDRLDATAEATRIGDEVLKFSGAVQRQLGETQLQADVREKARLQALIEAIANNSNKGDDQLIPFIEMAMRKIGKDSLAISVTPIESLHAKIQESLVQNPEFDLQSEQRDLLKSIDETLRGSLGREGSASVDWEGLKKKRKDRGEGESASGFMSVPPPQFDPSMMSGGYGSPPGATFTPSASRTVGRALSPGFPSTGDANIDEVMQIRRDAGNKRGDIEIERSQRGYDAASNMRRTKRDSDTATAARNLEAAQGRRGYRKPGDVDSDVAAAQERVRRQGRTVGFDRAGGGAVSDSPAQRRGVYDGARFGDKPLTVSSLPGPEPTPGLTREEGVAERRRMFGAPADAGPQIKAGDVDGPSFMSRNAGPVIVPGAGNVPAPPGGGGFSSVPPPSMENQPEGAAQAEESEVTKFWKMMEKAKADKLAAGSPSFMSRNAGPQITAGDVSGPSFMSRNAGPQVTEGLGRSGGFVTSSSRRSINRRSKGDFAFVDSGDRADDAGIEQIRGGEGASGRMSSKGPRTLAREEARRKAIAEREAATTESGANAEKVARGQAKRFAKELAREGIQDSAKSDRKWGVDPRVAQRRYAREKAGKKPSFMQQMGSGMSPADTPKEVSEAASESITPKLASNVNTDQTQQVADLQKEAIDYAKRTAAASEGLLEYIKSQQPGQGLVIS